MRLLASVGVFNEHEDGNFALTPLGDLLRADVPGSMRASVLLFAGVVIQDGWKELEYCVRTGHPAFRRTSPDADAFTAMAQDPEAAAIFDQAMATFAPQTAAAVAAAYDFSSFAKLADVGGGNGALLIGILNANPRLRGLVFDQPHVAAAREASTSPRRGHGGSRCEFVGGSFFEEVPRGADAYLLKHVIHDWDDEQATAILERCRARCRRREAADRRGRLPAPDRRLAREPRRRRERRQHARLTGGRQRSEGEFRELYAASGFNLTRIVPTPAPVCVIEGRPV